MNLVEITLLNVSPDVTDDLGGERFPGLVEQALISCSTAGDILKALRSEKKKSGCVGSLLVCRDEVELPTCHDVKDRLVASVKRYLKVPDKYMALTSLLLKSQAFYMMHPPISDNELPLVDLPRTQRGKPFIPTTVDASDGECNHHPLSVSHQFPFAGVARLVNGADDRMKLGMDIVVFDAFNTRLYDSVESFVGVFRESFTEWEWRRIHALAPSDDLVLIEFYLRWSMKEAYTKALGLGMHLDFRTFETRLSLVDCNGSDEGIWTAVSNERRGVHMRGSVVRNMGDEKEKLVSDWEFYFLPLYNDKSGSGLADGCACVCFGPRRNAIADGSDTAFDERVTWTTIHDLVQWHQRNA